MSISTNVNEKTRYGKHGMVMIRWIRVCFSASG